MFKSWSQVWLAALTAVTVTALPLLSGCGAPVTSGLVSVHAQGATHPIEPDCQCQAD